MKYRTTQKALKSAYGKKLAIGYCNAQYLLGHHEPIAYTCGVNGWNCDVYEVDGIQITTGYRGLVGVRPDYSLISEYEERARMVAYDYNLTFEERENAINNLLSAFLAKCFE